MRAGLYARPSHPDRSVDSQLEALTLYAAERSWTPVEFTDRAEDVNDAATQNGLDALLAAATRKEIDVVLVTGFDCLGHSFKGLLDILGQLEAAGITLACIEDGIKTRKPVRLFLAKIREAAAACASLRGAQPAPSDWTA